MPALPFCISAAMAQICDNLKYMTDTHEVSGRSNAEKGEIAPIGGGIFTAP